MAASPKEVLEFLVRSSKRVAVTVVGGVLVLIGLVMMVAPGPGILFLVLGFAVLGTEYAWAAAPLDKTKDTAERAGKRAKDEARRAGRRVKRTIGRG
jgi:hypothetical protein